MGEDRTASTGEAVELVSTTRLAVVLYDELRRLAARYLRDERHDHTLQPTALVHEAYLRLANQRRTHWSSRTQFCGVAAEVMRYILVDHARRRKAGKRGAGDARIGFEDIEEMFSRSAVDFSEVDEALRRLEKVDARLARIVELRFFGGLTVEETAEFLSISPITVKRDWQLARSWLYRELHHD